MAAITAPRPRITAKRGMTGAERRQAMLFYITVAPWIIGFVAFTVIPVGISAYLSLTKWNVIQAPVFIGLDNYVRMFTRDPDFYQSLKVTLIFAVTSVPLRMAVAQVLAILLNEESKCLGFFRTRLYIPAIVASTASAVLWAWLLNPKFGPVNGLLGIFGITGPSWFNDPNWALPGLILMSVWGIGGEMLIFL